MRVLLCGSTGMLGQAIVKKFSKHDIKLFTLARKNADINMDLLDEKNLKEVLDKLEPDLIINTVAIVNLQFCEKNPTDAYMLNARPVAVFANYARSNNKYLVQISTDHYYSDRENILHDESSQVSLLNEYAKTKFAGECFALTAENSLVIRTNIVGFRGIETRPTFIEWALNSLKNKEDMQLFDNVYSSSIAVSQLSQILYDLVTRKAKGIFNIASRESVSKKDFILSLAHKFEFSSQYTRVISYLPEEQLQRSTSMGLNVMKAERFLGYLMPDMEQVVNRLYSDYLEVEHS